MPYFQFSLFEIPQIQKVFEARKIPDFQFSLFEIHGLNTHG